MSLVRISILLVIGLSLKFLMSNTSNTTMSNAHQTVNRTTNLRGELPDSYEVEIFFDNEDFKHSHTRNNGGYRITIYVMGSISFLSTGRLNQAHCDLTCSIRSEDNRVTGYISIQRILTALENTNESAMKKKIRKHIVKQVLKEIEKL